MGKAKHSRRGVPIQRNPDLGQAGCVLGKRSWERDTFECGAGAPDPSAAASQLANKRWTLPPELARQKAKLLR